MKHIVKPILLIIATAIIYVLIHIMWVVVFLWTFDYRYTMREVGWETPLECYRQIKKISE